MNCSQFFQIRSDRTAGHGRRVPLYGKTGYGAKLWPVRVTVYDFAGTLAGIGVRYRPLRISVGLDFSLTGPPTLQKAHQGDFSG